MRKAESAHGKTEAKKQLKDTLALAEESENLSESEQARFDRIDHDYVDGKGIQMRLALQNLQYHPYQSWASADSRAGAIGSTESEKPYWIEAHAESCRDDTKHRWHPRILGFR